LIPEKVAAENDRGFFLLHDYDGIASGVAGKILDVKNHGSQAELGFGIIEHRWRSQVFDLGFLFRGNVFAEEFKIFSVNPGRDIAMSSDDCAFFGEDGISSDVVVMVVGVDNELDGKFRDHAYLAEQGLSGGFVFERIDYRDAIVADDEASVRARLTFGVVDGGINAVAERPEGEG